MFVADRQLDLAEASEVVVYFRPTDSTSRPLGIAASTKVMSTTNKQFAPRILPIEAGDSVYFPNADPILHNAFSTSPYNSFDTGIQPAGVGRTFTFSNVGLVKVYCNVHRAMFAFILVLDTPYYTRPGKNGEFALTGLPEEPGELVVFHDRASPWRKVITPGADELSIRIDLEKRIVPPHFNKFGKPYVKTLHDDY
jgi:plastocyanin